MAATLLNNLYPIELTGNAQGTITPSWVSRNRKLQADQLIDNEQGSITAEAGTTYTVRWYVDGVLQRTQSGLTATSDVLTLPAQSDGKQISLEVEAVREGLISGQSCSTISAIAHRLRIRWLLRALPRRRSNRVLQHFGVIEKTLGQRRYRNQDIIHFVLAGRGEGRKQGN